VQGVVERFKQTEPKVIISVNAVYYNGKIHDVLSKLNEITSQLSTVQKVVVIPFLAQASSTFPHGVTNW